MDPECLEKKFVVFDSELDLKAHEAEQHPNSMSRYRRRIDVQFGYSSGEGSSRRGGGGGRDDRRSRGQGGRNRDPLEEQVPQQPQLTPHQIQQIAMQREMELAQQRKQAAEAAAAAASAQEGMENLSVDDAASSSANRAQSMLRTRPPPGFGSSLSEPVAVQAPTPTAANRLAAGLASPARSSSPASNDWPSISAAASTPQTTTSRPSVAAVASQGRGPTPVSVAAPVRSSTPVTPETLKYVSTSWIPIVCLLLPLYLCEATR